jgi:hypothetical protein
MSMSAACQQLATCQHLVKHVSRISSRWKTARAADCGTRRPTNYTKFSILSRSLYVRERNNRSLYVRE